MGERESTRGFIRRETKVAGKFESAKPVRLVFVDDDEPFLRSIEAIALTNRNHSKPVEVRCYQMTGANGLVRQLGVWYEEGWIPDLLLIDLKTANESGHRYVDELHGQSRDSGDQRWARTPVVLHTSAKSNEEDASRMSHARADGYLWSKQAESKYLHRCVNELALFRDTARSRIQQERSRRWIDIVATAGKSLTASTDMEAALNKFKEDVVGLIERDLQIPDVMVHLRGRGDYYSLRATAGSLDLTLGPEDDRTRFPLLKAELESDIDVHQYLKVTPEQAGCYPHLGGRYAMCIAMRVPGEDRPVGAITLLRAEPFEEGDRPQGEQLAQMLGGLLGRQRYIDQRRKEQDAIRKLTHRVGRYTSEAELSQDLVELVHEVLHDPIAGVHCKATVRLVALGTSKLRRLGKIGDVDDEGLDIDLEPRPGEVPSIARTVVNTGQPVHARTPAELEKHGHMRCSATWCTSSELCVPILVPAPQGNSDVAIGTLNLEHEHERQYGEANERFVRAMAQIAAHGVVRLRREVAFKELARLTLQGMHTPAANQTWDLLNQAMASFAGYGGMVELQSPVEQDELLRNPWRVKRVFQGLEARSGSAKGISEDLDAWQRHIDETWGNSDGTSINDVSFTLPEVVRRCMAAPDEVFYVQALRAPRDDASLQQPIRVMAGDAFGTQRDAVRAIAFVPWRRDGSLIAGWLMYWFTPPAMDREALELLRRFADYAETLDRFGELWSSQAKQLELNQQRLALAEGAQLFEHTFRNDAIILGADVDRIVYAQSRDEAVAVGKNLRDVLARASDRAYALTALLSEAKPRPDSRTLLSDTWDKVCNRAHVRTGQLNIAVHGWPDKWARDISVKGVDVILEAVMEVIVQNSLDAMQKAEVGRTIWLDQLVPRGEGYVELTISDDGPGIAENIRTNLGARPGLTTKARSGGRALYLCQERLKGLDAGHIEFPESKQGAKVSLILRC